MMIARQNPGIKKPANEAKNEGGLNSFSKRLNMKQVRQTTKVLTDKTKGLREAKGPRHGIPYPECDRRPL